MPVCYIVFFIKPSEDAESMSAVARTDTSSLRSVGMPAFACPSLPQSFPVFFGLFSS